MIRKITWPGQGGDRALLTAIATKDNPDQINTILQAADEAQYPWDEIHNLYKLIDVEPMMDGLAEGVAQAR